MQARHTSCASIRLFTVLYFSVRSSRSSAFRYGLAILRECQNYLGGGGGPTSAPSVHLKIRIPLTVRRGISKRSHEKIGDCEQSRRQWPL